MLPVTWTWCCRPWRMGWDSNPRDPCRPAGFQDRCLQPLGHPSDKSDQILSEWPESKMLSLATQPPLIKSDFVLALFSESVRANAASNIADAIHLQRDSSLCEQPAVDRCT